MHDTPPPDEELRPALEALAEADADIARAYAHCGLPAVRRVQPGFAGLVRAIAGQQLSAKVAAVIQARLENALTEVTPASVLSLDESAAREIGLSGAKLRYMRGIAEAVESGRLSFEALADMPDDEAIAQLTALKGVGVWTAEIFLLFALRRPDVFPAQDLALQVAGQRLKGLPDRPDPATLRAVAEPWRPYRSTAARFLWHIYRHPGMP